MRLNNFGAGVSIFTKLFQTTCREAGGIMCVQFFEGPPPKIWEGQKTSKFRGDFWQLSSLTANISERIYITYQTSEKNMINHNPFHVGRKKFGELWFTNKKVLEVHADPPKRTFFDRLSGAVCAPPPTQESRNNSRLALRGILFYYHSFIYRAMHFSANARSWDIACRLSVCLSVCLSVTLVICDHIGWKSWKLIARTISTTPSLFVAKRRSTYSQGPPLPRNWGFAT